MNISFFWSERFMLSRMMLWLLLWVNGLGTLYGYQWYGWQITYTIEEIAPWLVWFVPDSPTASLFFTLAVAFLLRDHYVRGGNNQGSATRSGLIRGVIEVLAVITSIKYGIWAVAMIIAGNLQGDPFEWQHGMLIISHLGMAIEAIIFARFFSFRPIHIVIVAAWTLCNDMIDYSFDVFPSLPKLLHEFLPIIKYFTIGLSLVSIAFAFISMKFRRKS